MVLEFGDGYDYLTHLLLKGEGFKFDDMGVVIEIRRTRNDRNVAKFLGYPYFIFYLEEIFCTH